MAICINIIQNFQKNTNGWTFLYVSELRQIVFLVQWRKYNLENWKNLHQDWLNVLYLYLYLLILQSNVLDANSF